MYDFCRGNLFLYVMEDEWFWFPNFVLLRHFQTDCQSTMRLSIQSHDTSEINWTSILNETHINATRNKKLSSPAAMPPANAQRLLPCNYSFKFECNRKISRDIAKSNLISPNFVITDILSWGCEMKYVMIMMKYGKNSYQLWSRHRFLPLAMKWQHIEPNA